MWLCNQACLYYNMRSGIPCSLSATHLSFPWHTHSSANCFLSWMLRDSPSPVVPFTVSTQHNCWGLAYMHWFYWRQELTLLMILNRNIFPQTHFKIAMVRTSIYMGIAVLSSLNACVGNLGVSGSAVVGRRRQNQLLKLGNCPPAPPPQQKLPPSPSSESGYDKCTEGHPASQAKWLSILHPKETAWPEIWCLCHEWNHVCYLGWKTTRCQLCSVTTD